MRDRTRTDLDFRMAFRAASLGGRNDIQALSSASASGQKALPAKAKLTCGHPFLEFASPMRVRLQHEPRLGVEKPAWVQV